LYFTHASRNTSLFGERNAPSMPGLSAISRRTVRTIHSVVYMCTSWNAWLSSQRPCTMFERSAMVAVQPRLAMETVRDGGIVLPPFDHCERGKPNRNVNG
jgi:hypothetical protein